MTSKALSSLNERLKDIDQLIKAHSAITKFNNAESAAKKAGGELAKISSVMHALVTDPGRGKPKEVDAINRAAFVLLTAHFQGFVDDLHAEAGALILKGKANDPAAVIKLIKPPRSNPHVNIINQMFSGLAIYEVMDSISWQKCDNKSVKTRLTGYLETRNKIAHGKKEAITKQKVTSLKQFIETLARKLDEKVGEKAALVIGTSPW
ncbi:HEPN domain-containing protein [Pseudomonas sediminis]|uniref:HEPN domain-containing protein n=1 Tax=Pseudomonas sediminis TaxID=1691904 RepID=UPI00117A4BE0|nr:HEPN domain-containing protein [Pseudomonas sediminis]